MPMAGLPSVSMRAQAGHSRWQSAVKQTPDPLARPAANQPWRLWGWHSPFPPKEVPLSPLSLITQPAAE